MKDTLDLRKKLEEEKNDIINKQQNEIDSYHRYCSFNGFCFDFDGIWHNETIDGVPVTLTAI